MDKQTLPLRGDIILVRGGGDLATGVVQKLCHAGHRVAILEAAKPTAIRRTVALCAAVYEGTAQVEDILATRVDGLDAFFTCWEKGEVPVLVDPLGESIRALRPQGVIDAILAKRNLGTHAGMAPIVIALGPGFSAPEDAHAIIETMRGHRLGSIIWAGSALPNTGIPGKVGGQSALRVLRAPQAGVFVPIRQIGDIVKAGDPIFSVAGETVHAPFDGLVRGMMPEGITVRAGEKSGDIDPRVDSDCYTISDKARAIGGGVLDAYCALGYRASLTTSSSVPRS